MFCTGKISPVALYRQTEKIGRQLIAQNDIIYFIMELHKHNIQVE